MISQETLKKFRENCSTGTALMSVTIEKDWEERSTEIHRNFYGHSIKDYWETKDILKIEGSLVEHNYSLADGRDTSTAKVLKTLQFVKKTGAYSVINILIIIDEDADLKALKDSIATLYADHKTKYGEIELVLNTTEEEDSFWDTEIKWDKNSIMTFKTEKDKESFLEYYSNLKYINKLNEDLFHFNNDLSISFKLIDKGLLKFILGLVSHKGYDYFNISCLKFKILDGLIGYEFNSMDEKFSVDSDSIQEEYLIETNNEKFLDIVK